EGADGLRLVKGEWAVIDKERMREVLAQWERAEKQSEDGVSFLEAMRALAGLPDAKSAREGDGDLAADAPDWKEVRAGPWLARTLEELSRPDTGADPGALLRGTLRPYQRTGVAWLRALYRLGLGG